MYHEKMNGKPQAYSKSPSFLSWRRLSMRRSRSWKAAFESLKVHVEGFDVRLVVGREQHSGERCLRSPWASCRRDQWKSEQVIDELSKRVSLR